MFYLCPARRGWRGSCRQSSSEGLQPSLQAQKGPSGCLNSSERSLGVAGSSLSPSWERCSCRLRTGWGREQLSGWKNPKPLWSPESQSSSTRADPVRGRWKARDTAGLAECLAHLGTCPVPSVSSEEGVKTHSLIFPVHYLCISAFGDGIYCIKNSRKKLRRKKKFYWTRILNLCKTFLNWGLVIGNVQIGN